jgi:ABC-type transport system involved in cytochrome c biogenesis permease subunit
MSRARAEQTSTGYALLVVVGLGMLFLLFTAFLGVMKTHSGPLYGESNMLYTALIFYGGAGALYMGFGVTGIERYVKFASISTALGFAANTAAAAHRWYMAGHPPFSTLYEMLLSFVWTVAALTLIAERRYKVKIIGSVTMPLAVVSVILMQLLPSEVRPLVPALQSTWLHVHVSLAMLAYAACAVSFALAMMFLIQDDMKTETFQVLTALGMMAVYAGMMLRFRSGGFAVVGWDPAQNSEIFLSRGVRLFVTIPDLGWLFTLVLLSTITPIVLYVIGRVKQDESWFDYANKAMFVSILLQTVALVAFILRAQSGAYASPDADGSFPTALAASPFLLSGMLGGIFAGLLYLLLLWRREGLQKMLPPAANLDQITYKTICVAFPLLTLMIAVGAYWANQTWGSYWSWDPKETWAAITWLVYAGYLHMRVTRGWKGRRAAYFAILGFAVVIFTFFGVTYLLPGLHAYA